MFCDVGGLPGGIFAGPYDTDTSDTAQVILRDAIGYRPIFSADAYPTAGSNAAYNGSPETIYPDEITNGALTVDGDLPGGGAAAAVVGSLSYSTPSPWYDQAGLVNIDTNAVEAIALHLDQRVP